MAAEPGEPANPRAGGRPLSSDRPDAGLRVAAVILAAGEGRRMGGPKALLPRDGGTVLSHLVAAARAAGIDPVLVVCGAESERVSALARAAGAVPVLHSGWRAGQTSSLQAGLRALPPESEAFMIQPVDHAFTTAADFAALRTAFSAHPDPSRAIFRPVHAGRDFGHPVLFARSFVPEFLALGAADSARAVYRRHLALVTLVAVANPLIAKDLDTPADLRWL